MKKKRGKKIRLKKSFTKTKFGRSEGACWGGFCR